MAQQVPEGPNLDPVVLTGADIPEKIGILPSTIVGFRFLESSKSWEQVPIQIDEKHWQLWNNIKDNDC